MSLGLCLSSGLVSRESGRSSRSLNGTLTPQSQLSPTSTEKPNGKRIVSIRQSIYPLCRVSGVVLQVISLGVPIIIVVVWFFFHRRPLELHNSLLTIWSAK